MALYLVVAHQTAASKELLDALHGIVASDPGAEFTLLVPSTPGKHLWVWVEGDDRDNARRIADQAATSLRNAGLVVERTMIGAANPLVAIREAQDTSEEAYEAVIVSTLPAGISRWVRQDLPNQARKKLGLKVIAVTARTPETRTVDDHRTEEIAAAASEPTKDFLSLEQLARFRGSQVSCVDGTVGRMTELLYDYATLEPAWIGVASKPLPFRTLLLPATLAQVDHGNLVVASTRERILGQPHVDIGEGIPSLSDEQHLYRYFGLPQESIRELRVLHRYDHLPGLERNWQNILAGEDLPAAVGQSAERT